MAGRHRAPRRSWRPRTDPASTAQASIDPVSIEPVSIAPVSKPPVSIAPVSTAPVSLRRNTRPALAAGLAGTLMVSLCVATLAPAAGSTEPTAIAEFAGPLPLRLAAERASRNGARSDLTLEAETAAAQAAAAERQRLRTEAAAKSVTGPVAAVPVALPGGTPQQNRELGRAMTAEYGWDAGQFACLDRIWSQESNWTTTAQNPSSGAYGIPQSLPGTKMASAGADWSSNPATQIAWGLGYIDAVYGTPCSAWDFKQGTGWY